MTLPARDDFRATIQQAITTALNEQDQDDGSSTFDNILVLLGELDYAKAALGRVARSVAGNENVQSDQVN